MDGFTVKQLSSPPWCSLQGRRWGGGVKKYGCCYAKICHKMIMKLGCALMQTRDMPTLMLSLTVTTLIYVSYRGWNPIRYIYKTDAKKKICFHNLLFPERETQQDDARHRKASRHHGTFFPPHCLLALD